MTSLLAIHPGALGDVILFGHLLKMLGGAATLVGGGEKSRLLAGLGVAQRAVAFEGLPMHEVFAETPLDDCRLAALLGGHDRLLSCYGDGDVNIQLRLAAMAGVDAASFLPIRPPQEYAGHLLELWCDLLGMDADVKPPAWPVPDEWRMAANATIGLVSSQKHGVEGAWPAAARCASEERNSDAGETPAPRTDVGKAPATHPIAVIHPGAGGKGKCWPVERFAAVADHLRRRGLQSVWVVGPVEMETWPPGAMALIGEDTLVSNPPLITLAGLLAQASVFIGNDSGPAHLAASIGTRTVAMFGPTSAVHFGPIGPHVATVVAEAMDQIEPARVIAAVDALLE